jgi:hypothetical protein
METDWPWSGHTHIDVVLLLLLPVLPLQGILLALLGG